MLEWQPMSSGKKKNVMLTGIGGSIGCHTLAHFMHNTDWNIVGIDSFRHKGWQDRVKVVTDTNPEWSKRLRLITHDLVSPFSELTKKKIGKIDYIVNLASISDVEASITDPVTTIHNNVFLTTTMLEYAREVKPEKFIQFSTDEVYGPTANKKHKYKEWSPLVPSNPYAASKACQEMIAIAYWRTYGVPLIITNTMNNFGEMQSKSKYPVMIQKAISSGEKITIHGKEGNIGSRSYIHSQNTSDAVLFILKKIKPILHKPRSVDLPVRLNIAGDMQLDNLELVKIIAKLMNKKPVYQLVNWYTARPGHDPHYGLDDSELRTMGWKSPLTFEDSLKRTIEWQMNNPEWIE